VSLTAARQVWPGRRQFLVFQPHRYTRTRELFDDFVEVLSRVDELLLLPVYGAGEAPIAGADSQALLEALRKRGRQVTLLESLDQVVPALRIRMVPDDVVLTMGAGSIGQLAARLPEELS